jgi:hypothetical protein
MTKPTVLIVGAGLTGLSAARHAHARGWSALVVERADAPGGRLATQRGDHGSADVGAQFFSVRDAAFAAAVADWAAAGVAVEWSRGFPVLAAGVLRDGSDGHVRWRIAGGMERLAAHLADGLDCRFGHAVSGLRADGGRWLVTAAVRTGATTQDAADAVVLTQPVPQQLDLLAASGLELPAATLGSLRGVRYDPCLALLLESPDGEAALPAPGGVRIEDPASPVSWIASQRRKGLRQRGEGLVLHFRGRWSAERCHLDPLDPLDLLRQLREAAAPPLGLLGVAMPGATAVARVWRHSLATVTVPEPCLRLDPGAPLLLAGDAFGATPRMEGAWLSGRAAAAAL